MTESVKMREETVLTQNIGSEETKHFCDEMFEL